VAICLPASYALETIHGGRTGPELKELLIETCAPRSTRRSIFKNAQDDSESDYLIFDSVDQVRQLLEYYQNNQLLCPIDYRDALLGLQKLLVPEILDDVCSKTTFEALKAYHLNFIHFYGPSLDQDELNLRRKLAKKDKSSRSSLWQIEKSGAHLAPLRPIPEPLRRFFILFAKQINGLCTIRIAELLPNLIDRKMSIYLQNYELVRRLARKQLGRRALAETSTRKLSSEPRLKDLKLIEYTGNKLFMILRSTNPMFIIQRLCSKHFRPLYLNLFGTVLSLNSLGYNDWAISWQVQYNQFVTNTNFTRWYDIIQICEIAKDIQLVDPTDPLADEHSQQPLWFQEQESSEESSDETQAEANLGPDDKLAFGSEMRVNEIQTVKMEIKRFHRYIKWSIRERTSQLVIRRRQLIAFLSRQYDKIRLLGENLKTEFADFFNQHTVPNAVGIFLLSGLIIGITIAFTGIV